MSNTFELNTNKTSGQFIVDFQKDGYAGCTPIINGEPATILTFGYVSQSDYDACCRLIREAVDACDGDVNEAAKYIHNAVLVSASSIKADEAVDIDGYEMLISYDDKTIYYGTEKVAEISEDITDAVAIKALLIERARNAIYSNEVDKILNNENDEYIDNDDDWIGLYL